MRKILLCSATYKEHDPMYNMFRENIKPRFEKYCEHHGFELVILYENYAPLPEMLGWSRLFWIKNNKELQDGDIVAGIGADCCLINCKESMVFDYDFCVPIESTGMICMDFFIVRISDWSRKFLDEMCSLERIEKTKGTNEEVWKENGIIFQVLGLHIKEDENKIGERKGTPFTKEELKQHVKILPVKWNVTYDPEDVNWFLPISDRDRVYSIIASYYKPERYCSIDQTIIRHLSSSTILNDWAKRYLDHPLIF